MKKILPLLAAAIFILGCDDGDITFNEFNLGEGVVSNCTDTNLYYRTNGSEAYFLTLSQSDLALSYDDDGNLEIKEIVLASNNLTYRNYNGDVPSGFFCNEVPPTNPVLLEEWDGNGTITIETTPDLQSGKLMGYKQKVVLKNITFTNGDASIVTSNKVFGTITTSLNISFNFMNVENPTVLKCSQNNFLYRTSGRDAFILDLPSDYVNNIVGVDTYNIENLANDYAVYFEVYSGTAGSQVICDAVAPITPVVEQRFVASSGTITITTTEDDVTPGQYNHQIMFTDMVISRTDASTSLLLTDLLTEEEKQEVNIAGGLILGTYITN